MKVFILKRNIILFFLIITLLSATLFAISKNKAFSTVNSNKKLPIYCVDKGDEKIISISFDAAWGNEDTEQLISILEKYGVKATFFVVGDWVDKYPESVKALSDAGHEVMNHSDSHPHMPQISEEKMIEQISNCNKKIEEITGIKPILFRAPYGDYSNKVIETVEKCGCYCIQWNVDSLDWKDLSATQITEKVTKKVCPGSIVLFHNAAKHTPEALPQIIETLQDEGYKFVPISQLIYADNYEIDFSGKQILKQEN